MGSDAVKGGRGVRNLNGRLISFKRRGTYNVRISRFVNPE